MLSKIFFFKTIDGFSNFVISIKYFLTKNKILRNLNPLPVENIDPPTKVKIKRKNKYEELKFIFRFIPDVDKDVITNKKIS